jgi:hypothetical protein
MRGGLVCVSFALAGCNMQPMPFPPSPGELSDKPGLFTGANGALTICCNTASAPAPAPTPTKPSE